MVSSVAALLLVFLGSAVSTCPERSTFKCPKGTFVGDHVQCLDSIEDCFCIDTNDRADHRPECWKDYGNDKDDYDKMCGWNDDYSKCRKQYSPYQCYNHYEKQCKKRGYHRHLSTLENTNVLSEHHGECMADNYNMFLIIQGAHMTGLATPSEAESSCPNLVFHSRVQIEGNMKKTVMTLKEEGVASIKDEEKLHLGAQSLSSIVSAFESADISKKGEKTYDAVTNNCVVLLRNMADPLGIAVDKRMINFVSKRLLAESGSHMIDLMKGSPALSAVVGTGGRHLKGIGAEEIVSKVIELYL